MERKEADNADGGALLRQAALCREMGSPLTAGILEAAKRQLGQGPLTARKIADWPGDRGHAAVALRLAGGFHALARAGAVPALSALYRDRAGDFDAAVAETLRRQDAFLADWIASPPKTNEVGRTGAVMAALLVAAARFGLPFELLELGSSAGLNLNLHRYAYELGGVAAGDPASPVRIRPEWRGAPPPAAAVEIRSTRGVDIDPIDLADPAQGERLTAYIWADVDARMERFARALAIARAHPPALQQGDAVEWLEAALATPQAAGTTRAVFHSIVLQYLDRAARERVRRALDEAGTRATARRPLAWVSFEWDAPRSGVELTLTTWPGGQARVLAICQAHAGWIDWRGDGAP